MNKPVLLIRYDGGKPRQLECKGELCPMFFDKHGNPVYIISDRNVAARLAVGNPNRYRLFRSKPFDYKHTTPQGISKWIRPTVWSYKEVTKQAGKDERGEYLYKDSLDWYEDPTGKDAVEPVEQSITGIIPKEAITIRDEMRSTLEENARLKSRIAAQDEKMTQLLERVDALAKRLELAEAVGCQTEAPVSLNVSEDTISSKGNKKAK